MAKVTVNFTFHSGVKRQLFRNVRLSGSWDGNGQFSNQWTQVPMAASHDETGCDAFSASVSFDAAQMGTTYQWGVFADIIGAPNTWVVATEVLDENSNQRYRSFQCIGAARFHPAPSNICGTCMRFLVEFLAGQWAAGLS